MTVHLFRFRATTNFKWVIKDTEMANLNGISQKVQWASLRSAHFCSLQRPFYGVNCTVPFPFRFRLVPFFNVPYRCGFCCVAFVAEFLQGAHQTISES